MATKTMLVAYEKAYFSVPMNTPTEYTAMGIIACRGGVACKASVSFRAAPMPPCLCAGAFYIPPGLCCAVPIVSLSVHLCPCVPDCVLGIPQ